MKTKQKLKYKGTLPKADYSMDPNALSNMNMQKEEEASMGGDEGGGMGALGGLGIGLNAASGLMSSFIPKQDMNNISKGGQIGGKVSKSVFGALSQSPEPISKSIGMVGSFLVDPIMALVNMVKEKKKDPLHDQKFEPLQAKVNYSFGTPQSSANPMAKYGMPLFGGGGSMKYNTNFRPATSYEQKYNKETGLWEVGDAKPKQTTITKKTVPQKVKPIYTSDPKDKRLQAYNDSLSLYNISQTLNTKLKNGTNHKEAMKLVNSESPYLESLKEYNGKYPKYASKGSYYYSPNGIIPNFDQAWLYAKPKQPILYKENNISNDKPIQIVTEKSTKTIPAYKKPVQPVIYQKPEVKVPVPKKNIKGFLENAEKDYWHKDKDVLAFRKVFKEKFGEEPSRNFSEAKYDYDSSYEAGVRPVFNKEDGLYHWDSRFKADDHPNRYVNGVDTKTGEQIKGKSLNDFLKQQRKNPNGGINTYIRKDTKSPWIQQDFALGGDPRAQSNIEAEKDEAMRHTSDKVENIGGKKHPQGGTPIEVQPEHKYIYSDSIGKDKDGNITLNEKDVVISFADEAKGIQRKYSKREGDPIVDATKKFELDSLQQKAEQARVAKEQIEMGKQMKKYKAKYGMALKKYANSGYVPFTNFNQYGDEQVDPNSTLAMQQQLLQYNPNALPIFGADNKWGKETTAGFANNLGVYNMMANQTKDINQIQAPSFGGGAGYQNSFVGPNMPSSRLPRGGFGPYPQGQIGDEKTRGVAQDRVATDSVNKERNGFFQDLTTGDKMQLASMLPAFGFNLGMGLRPYDKEPIRKNQYENDVLSLMSNRKFDIQNYLNQSNLATNTAREDIGNNSTSVGGKMANLQKLYANNLNALGDVTTKGQEMNNQYRAEEANTKNILGESNRAEAIRATGITAQNKARKQQFLGKAFEQLGQGIAATGQAANQSQTNKILAKSLSEIAPDFDIKELKDVYKDKDGYLIFRGQKFTYDPQRDELLKVGDNAVQGVTTTKSQYAPKSFDLNNFAKVKKGK